MEEQKMQLLFVIYYNFSYRNYEENDFTLYCKVYIIYIIFYLQDKSKHSDSLHQFHSFFTLSMLDDLLSDLTPVVLQRDDSITSERSLYLHQVFSYDEPHGWLELHEPRFDANGNRMVFVWWHPQANGDSYPHVTLVDLTNPEGNPTPITSGTFSVSEVAGWNLDTDEV